MISATTGSIARPVVLCSLWSDAWTRAKLDTFAIDDPHARLCTVVERNQFSGNGNHMPAHERFVLAPKRSRRTCNGSRLKAFQILASSIMPRALTNEAWNDGDERYQKQQVEAGCNRCSRSYEG